MIDNVRNIGERLVFRIIPELRILRLTFLNYADSNSFFDLFSVYQKTIDHLNLKLLRFVGILQILRFDFKKFRIFEIVNFYPCKILSLSF